MTHTAPTSYFSIALHCPIQLLTCGFNYSKLNIYQAQRKEWSNVSYDGGTSYTQRSSRISQAFRVYRQGHVTFWHYTRREIGQPMESTPRRLAELYQQSGQQKSVGVDLHTLSTVRPPVTVWTTLASGLSILLSVASIHGLCAKLQGACTVAQSSGRKSVDMTTRLFTHPTSLTLAPFARQTGGAA